MTSFVRGQWSLASGPPRMNNLSSTAKTLDLKALIKSFVNLIILCVLATIVELVKISIVSRSWIPNVKSCYACYLYLANGGFKKSEALGVRFHWDLQRYFLCTNIACFGTPYSQLYKSISWFVKLNFTKNSASYKNSPNHSPRVALPKFWLTSLI